MKGSKLASIHPSRAQIITALFTTINAVVNVILVAVLLTGGIMVRGAYIEVVASMDPLTVQNAKSIFSDATFFVHQAREKYEANDGLPFNVTAITQSITNAMDGVAFILNSVNASAIDSATTTLGQPSTQEFLAHSIQQVLNDATDLLGYLNKTTELLARISVSPSSSASSQPSG
jgi:hypothetical protein